MLKNIRAADILGTDMDAIAQEFGERGLRRVYGVLSEESFLPYFPSKNIIREFDQIAERIQQENPFESAEEVLNEIYDDISDISLTDDFEIDINDYLTPDPGLLGQMLPQTPAINPGVLQSNLQSSAINQQGLTPSEQALLSEEEKAIRLRQRGLA